MTKTTNDTTTNETVKIAFPTSDSITVDEHFGHCRNFVVFDVKGKEITNKALLDSPPHSVGAFPRFLGKHGVNAIITGGMGQRAISLFKEQNIEVILGARGNIEDNLKEYIEGFLESKGSGCDHSGEEHHHHHYQ